MGSANVVLTIAYDGTNYHGWQKTAEGPSVEETLEAVLVKIFQIPIALQAASRTDAGVHASQQVVNFFTPRRIDWEKLKHSLNGMLPDDIAVNSVEEAAFDFHPTLHTVGKEYRYQVCLGAIQLPEHRLYSWHYFKKFNMQELYRAIPYLVGTKDFAALCNVLKNCNYADTTRTIQSIEIQELPDSRLLFSITGSNFLYRMARNLVGTLMDIGHGKLQVEQLPAILASRDRTQAGMTAPAHGLCLHQVFYP